MIVDVHCHLGWDHTFDEDFPARELVRKMDRFRIDIQVVQPGTCHDLETVRGQHDAIAQLAADHPGRFFGLANPSPHLPEEDYQAEVERCVEELGFVGLKLHPMAHGVNPGSRSGRKAFRAARDHGLPLMVHTGAGAPFASPVNLLGLAQEYSELKIIMAHCGQIIYANAAAAVLAARENVFADTSWTPGFILKDWTRTFGPRFMLGSDHADNAGTELAKIRTVGLTAQEEARFLGLTALDVFNLEVGS